MTKLYKILGLAALACMLVSGETSPAEASGISVGFNVVMNYAAPTGETPQSALARIGGNVFRDYTDPFSGDTDWQRIRLVRYGMTYRPSNAPAGATYQLGGEANISEQDSSLRFPEQAPAFAQWHHDMAAVIRQDNPTARIIGTAVWNWDGAGSSCCTRGSDSYAWFIAAHLARYGVLPDMQYLGLDVYPWHQSAWDDPPLGIATALAQIDGAQQWSNGRWPVVVTEWGLLRKPFTCTVSPQQTETERRDYTRGVLDGFAARAVPLALYYASHEQQCDSNGWMSWLINRDGSLTVEGQAHVGITPWPTAPAGPRAQGTAVRSR